MSPNAQWFPSHLKEMTQDECLELLAAHQVGRVAYCDELGAVILPVNYVLDHDCVLIQISPHSTLARHLRSAPASFEIDDFEEYNQSGWRPESHRPTHPGRGNSFSHSPALPKAAGNAGIDGGRRSKADLDIDQRAAVGADEHRVEVELGDLGNVLGELAESHQHGLQRIDVGWGRCTEAVQERPDPQGPDGAGRITDGHGREQEDPVVPHVGGDATGPHHHQRTEAGVADQPVGDLDAAGHWLHQHGNAGLTERGLELADRGYDFGRGAKSDPDQAAVGLVHHVAPGHLQRHREPDHGGCSGRGQWVGGHRAERREVVVGKQRCQVVGIQPTVAVSPLEQPGGQLPRQVGPVVIDRSRGFGRLVTPRGVPRRPPQCTDRGLRAPEGGDARQLAGDNGEPAHRYQDQRLVGMGTSATPRIAAAESLTPVATSTTITASTSTEETSRLQIDARSLGSAPAPASTGLPVPIVPVTCVAIRWRSAAESSGT